MNEKWSKQRNYVKYLILQNCQFKTNLIFFSEMNCRGEFEHEHAGDYSAVFQDIDENLL